MTITIDIIPAVILGVVLLGIFTYVAWGLWELFSSFRRNS